MKNSTLRILTVSVLLLCSGDLAGCGKGSSAAKGSPKAEENTPAAKEPTLTPERARSAGIEVVAAGPAKIRSTLTLHGSIRPNSEREGDIRARYPGVVRDVTKRVGDTVNSGEELLRVESNESLQTYAIRSPIPGRVIERRTNPGDAVDGSTILLRVSDLSTVWVEFALFARDLGQVRPGMTVSFKGAGVDEQGEARITYVAPAGQADSQSVVARAVVDNRAGRWVPGQFVTGEVVVGDAQVPVAVAPAALQEMHGKTVVFIQRNQAFEPRAVQLGKRSRDAVEILSGLSAGDRYATQNSYLIKAEFLKGEGEDE
ncbi:MAG: efflux RND transporter periplasmic adaptor subunit [Proteobacteria bacterium]|nr:efflux RND transporter periplasmic adaptor subunit [Pseudomonadota bacterium]